MVMEPFPSLVSTLGFPIAVCCYLFWERHHMAKVYREERQENQKRLSDAIKDFTIAIGELKVQIVKLNERCNGGKT